VVRSAAGLALLLAEGLGDSLRVSLTEPPEEEVRVGYQILQALELRQRGINLISCPTCGRCRVDLPALARKAERALAEIASPLWVAVMGCEVNGPGEAREADVGIACGKESGLLFARGEVVEKLPTAKLVPAMVRTVRQLAQSWTPARNEKGDSKDGSAK
jgi:(E)-4-hydroxy-3-methylbut-2-enyl-diphosphate synthase